MPGSVGVRLDIQAAGAAAGSVYVPLDIANTSAHPCRLAGFPAVSFASGRTGAVIGRPATRAAGLTYHPVTLPPGATAHAWLQIAAAANFSPASCHPVMAAGIRVALPGQSRAVFVRHPFPACGAAAGRASVLLTVQPIQPGAGRRGTAP